MDLQRVGGEALRSHDRIHDNIRIRISNTPSKDPSSRSDSSTLPPESRLSFASNLTFQVKTAGDKEEEWGKWRRKRKKKRKKKRMKERKKERKKEKIENVDESLRVTQSKIPWNLGFSKNLNFSLS